MTVEATRHHPNEGRCSSWATRPKPAEGPPGTTSKAGLARTRARVRAPGPSRTGLSTGEGLIWAARDPDGADAGVADARLLVV